MISQNLSLRISAIFIVFLASFGGICFPLMANSKTNAFRVLNTASAGVMLGLAMMHLLPDAEEILSSHFPGYNWSYALACAGVFLVLTIEQLVLLVSLDEDSDAKKPLLADYQALNVTAVVTDEHDHKSSHDHFSDHEHSSVHSPMNDHAHDSGHDRCNVDHSNITDHDHEHAHNHDSHDHEHQHDHGHNDHRVAQTSIEKVVYRAMSHDITDGGHDHGEHGDHDHDHGLGNVMNSTSLQKLITAYVLEFSIAVHSIIIGVDLGMLSQAGETLTLITLIVALCFHQFVEGVGLGSAIQSSRGSLGESKVLGFVAIFSLTMPLGIIIGICASSDEMSSAQEIAKGIANSFATGSLMYISLSEMVSDYFGASDLKKNPRLRMSMLSSFGAGVLVMAIIANWA